MTYGPLMQKGRHTCRPCQLARPSRASTPGVPLRRNRQLVLGFQPGIDVFAHHVLRDAVSLLNLSLELIALAINPVEIIVRELPPLLLDLTLPLLPVPLDPIPIQTSPTKVPSGNLGRIGKTRDIDYNSLSLMALRGQARRFTH